MSLKETLENVNEQARWRFHFPAHAGHALSKSSALPEQLFKNDLTELPELDVLGQPEGILKDLQAHIASSYGAQQSFALVNGASVGLMAALLALPVSTKRKVLLARNVHRSVIQGLILSGHEPIWILPEQNPGWGVWGAVTAESVKQALESHYNDIAAVVLTHPTYEGIPSDIASIQNLTKSYNIPLIIDEAHGALWQLFDSMPDSALSAGADVVIHSLHKSAGTLTQAALLHTNHDSLISPQRLQEAINTLQTTSPSYPLLLSIEETLNYWQSEEGQRHLQKHLETTGSLRDWIQNNCKHIDAMALPTGSLQLLLRHRKMSAETLATELEETYNIAFESVNEQSVFLHFNPGLPSDAFDALKTALTLLDESTEANAPRQDCVNFVFAPPVMAMSPRDAFLSEGKWVSKEAALGEISRKVVAACPPGIPILMPGEKILDHHLNLLSSEDDGIEIVTPHPDATLSTLDKGACFTYSSAINL